MKPSIRIGVDLGGTKIEAIALGVDGTCLARERIPTPTIGYEAIIQEITSLVHEIEVHIGERGSVGIGMPGTISASTGLAKNSNTICLNGKPFDKDISKALRREVRVANDANCFALSEAIDGAGADGKIIFGVIIGTGTGGGIVSNKTVLFGKNSIAGEWGHNPLPWPKTEELPGPSCYCGKRGCLETFVSGPGFCRNYRELSGKNKTPSEIVASTERGERAAKESLNLYIDRFARGLASVMNIIDPDIIVLGGGMSNIKCLYREVPKIWGKYVFSDSIDTDLRPAIHGDSSGGRGAAWLWSVDEDKF